MSLRRKHSRLQVQLVQYGAIAALGALALGANRPGAPAAPAASIAHPLNGYVTLARGAHPLARPENDLGRLNPAKRLENLAIVFKLSPQQQKDLDTLRDQLVDPASPNYHQWLTPESYAARFGAKPDDIARTNAWLTSQGLDVVSTSRLGARVNFAGTVEKVEAAFRAEMHRYKVGTETHYAMSSAPSFPAELSDIVLALHNSHDFYPRARAHNWKVVDPQAKCPAGDMDCAGDGFAPKDWSAVYDVKTTTYDGTGVTIAVVGIAEIAQSDVTAFRTTYGLAADPLTMTLVPGTGAAQGANGAAIEAILDTEWSNGIAPKATINYVYTGGGDPNVDDAAYYAIEQNFGGILSESFGGCEQGETPADADVVAVYGSAANALGITYLASSGDSGAAGCQGTGGLYVSLPAAFPGVTGVGGTEFPTAGGLFPASGNATGYSTTEAIWNESNDPTAMGGVGAGGGGISTIFARPAYQTATVAPPCTILGSLPVTGLTASAMRQVPDIAFTAASGSTAYGYFIECTIDAAAQDCSPTGGTPVVLEIGGTSASTPSFAGVLALANQAAGGRLGNINPLLYQLPTTVFHDVVNGNNEIKCMTGASGDPGCPAGGLYGYAATAGYDCASGLGSLDSNNFVTAIKALAPSTTTLGAITSPLTEGTAVPLTATVTGTGTLTGTVTFSFQSYLANGLPDLSWTLGTAAVTGGTATASLAIPPGMVGYAGGVDVYATYGGDTTNRASVSAKVHATFNAPTFCVTPGATSVALGATVNFAAAGGVPPYLYRIYNTYADDTTGGPLMDGGYNGSNLDEVKGTLTVGTQTPGGYILVEALDSDGAETFSEVTVGTPSGPSPFWTGDAGVVAPTTCTATVSDGGTNDGGNVGSDGGPTTGSDGGPNGSNDGGLVGLNDGSTNEDGGGNGATGGSSSGCSCTTAGGTDRAPAGMLGGIVLGLGLIARRRRARR